MLGCKWLACCVSAYTITLLAYLLAACRGAELSAALTCVLACECLRVIAARVLSFYPFQGFICVCGQNEPG